MKAEPFWLKVLLFPTVKTDAVGDVLFQAPEIASGATALFNSVLLVLPIKELYTPQLKTPDKFFNIIYVGTTPNECEIVLALPFPVYETMSNTPDFFSS